MTAYTEPTSFPVPRNSTLTFTDASGTPNTFRLRYGSCTITPGGYNTVRAMDESGDFVGEPQQTGQAGVTTMAVTGRMFGTGNQAAAVALVDIINDQLGTSTAMQLLTTEGVATNLFIFASVALALPDVGTGKGATYSLTSVIVQPGGTVTKNDDGFELSCTFESPNAAATIVTNP